MRGGALPTKQPSSGLHSTIFTYGRAWPEERVYGRGRRSKGTKGSTLSTGFCFTSFDFADFFEGILHLFFLIGLGDGRLTANLSDLNMPYLKHE